MDADANCRGTSYFLRLRGLGGAICYRSCIAIKAKRRSCRGLMVCITKVGGNVVIRQRLKGLPSRGG